MSSSGKEGVLKIRDSAGYEWEEVKSPSPPPAPSSENAHLIPPEPAAEPRQLCGYLSKATKGPIKTWKSRWFVFEDQRCRLYYYNSRNDFTPQGYINISNGLFSYSVEEASKCQFEIRADGRVHLLQASSKEAMSYWLNQLQGRRRKFSKHRRKDSCKDRSAEVTFVGGASSVGGSTMRDGSSEEEELNGISEDVVPLELQEQKKSPHTGSGPSRTRLSFKRLFRPTLTPPTVTGSQASAVYHSPNTQRRSNFYLDPPGKESSTSDSEAPSSTEPTSTAPPTAPAVNNSSSVADTTRSTPISLSRKLFNKVTRHSQVSAENDCLHCQMAKEKIDELECELCRKEQEVKDRDEINEFLRNEIRMSDMKMKVK